MSEFEGQIWTLQENDKLHLVCTIKQIKKKTQLLNSKGREQSVASDKLGWKLAQTASNTDDWCSCVVSLEQNIRQIQQEIDIELLWETASDGGVGDIEPLTELYFGQSDALSQVALWRALAKNRLYFKRKGAQWEPRLPEQVEELELQRQRELEKQQAQQAADDWLALGLNALNKNSELPVSETALPFVTRLENWLRGDVDKALEEYLEKPANQQNCSLRELVFDLLYQAQRLPADSDRDIMVAGLRAEFSQNVLTVAAQINPWLPKANQTLLTLDFSIDDEETREVDDALGIEANDQGWLIKVAIADPARLIAYGDTLDREAAKRGTTVYLPTQTILMLPEHISCQIASLTAEQPRSVLLVAIQLNAQADVLNVDLQRAAAVVKQRLSYDQADTLLTDGNNETAQKLRQLLEISQLLAQQRKAAGSFSFNRPEYKIEIDNEKKVKVKLLNSQSPSRALVAEMMIQANALAARYAQRHEIPIIYRGQEAPSQPIDAAMLAEPLAFYKVIRLIKPSSLSLHAINHSGLGLACYTQLTSPLRRFADLVMQRQLLAHLAEQPYPYDQEELFKVLAAAEQCSRNARMAENNAKKRWFIFYLQQQNPDAEYEAMVIEPLKIGFKAELLPWGVDTLLMGDKSLSAGQKVQVKIDKLRLKALQIRLKPLK